MRPCLKETKKLYPCSCLELFLLLISCNSFNVSGLTLRYLIYLELIIVQGERWGSSFILLQVNAHFFQSPIVEETTFSPPICILGIFVKKKIRWR